VTGSGTTAVDGSASGSATSSAGQVLPWKLAAGTFGQRLGPIVGVERVLLVDPHPGELAPLADDLLAQPGELVLPLA